MTFSVESFTPGDWLKLLFAAVVVVGGYASLHLVVRNTAATVDEIPAMLSDAIDDARQELKLQIASRQLLIDREFASVRREISDFRKQYLTREVWVETKGEYDGWRRSVDSDLRRLQPDNPRIGQKEVRQLSYGLNARIARAETMIDELDQRVTKLSGRVGAINNRRAVPSGSDGPSLTWPGRLPD